MTIHRAPLTFHGAMWSIGQLLGWDRCAHITGKQEFTLYAYSNQGNGRDISMRDALLLERAYRRAGHPGYPFLEAYAAQHDIDLTGEGASAAELLAVNQEAAREGGEAIAAVIELAASPDRPHTRVQAEREVDEALSAFTRLKQLLRPLRRDKPP